MQRPKPWPGMESTLQTYWLFILHFFKDLSQILLFLKSGVCLIRKKAHVSFFARNYYKIGGGPLSPQYLRKAESLHCSPETITTLLIGYTPIENVFGVKKLKIKFKNKKKRI